MLKEIIEKIKDRLGITAEKTDDREDSVNRFRLYERDEIFGDYDETEKAPKVIVALITVLLVIPVICMILCFATLLCFFKLMLTPKWYFFSLLL